MPRDVIMPALGMAQDTGRIVTWLKSPGEAVAAGDALFEVETDKATMEVEAAEAGYLSDVRFAAGTDVPVGEVIARIASSAEDAATDAPADNAPAPAAEATNTTAHDLPEGREVIMPALGMTQDTGRIVAWAKAPGDPVGASDILFEVETDKATMEVEAGHDGWLAATLGAAGEDVPVGQTIAIISADKPSAPVARSLDDAPVARSLHDAPAAPTVPPAAAATPAAAPAKGGSTPPEAGPSVAAPVATGGRILASPKARRLARDRGLDLAGLVRLGVPQPYHVADLETLAQAPMAAAAPAGVRSELEAVAPADEFAGFLDWAASETTTPAARAGVLAAFAAAALRAATGAGTITIRYAAPDDAVYTDADHLGLAAVARSEAETPPDLTLRDLTATRVCAARLAQDAGPVLTLTAGPDATLRLHLAADPAALPDAAALAFLDAMAGRLADPVRHLL